MNPHQKKNEMMPSPRDDLRRIPGRKRRRAMEVEPLEGRCLLATITEYPLQNGFSNLQAIVSRPDGNLWFKEGTGGVNSVGMMTTSGAIAQNPIPTPGAKAVGIAVSPDGAIWFAESGTNESGRNPVAGDAPLTATGAKVLATAGVPFSGVVPTVVDGNRQAAATVPSVTIDWGNSTTAAGGVVYDASAKPLRVEGAHTYVYPGVDTLYVEMSDLGGQMTTGGVTHFVPSDGVVVTTPTPVVPPGTHGADAGAFQFASTPILPHGNASGSGSTQGGAVIHAAGPAAPTSQNSQTQTAIHTSAAFASQMLANELAMVHGPSVAAESGATDGLSVRYLGALGSITPIGPGGLVRANGELFQELDRLEKHLEAGQPLQDVQSVVEAGAVVSVGYILLQGRGLYWLLSALAAGPVWGSFDPLRILTDWEEEKKRRSTGGPASAKENEEDESLQSILDRGRDGCAESEKTAHDASEPGARKPHRKPAVRRASARAAARS